MNTNYFSRTESVLSHGNPEGRHLSAMLAMVLNQEKRILKKIFPKLREYKEVLCTTEFFNNGKKKSFFDIALVYKGKAVAIIEVKCEDVKDKGNSAQLKKYKESLPQSRKKNIALVSKFVPPQSLVKTCEDLSIEVFTYRRLISILEEFEDGLTKEFLEYIKDKAGGEDKVFTNKDVFYMTNRLAGGNIEHGFKDQGLGKPSFEQIKNIPTTLEYLLDIVKLGSFEFHSLYGHSAINERQPSVDLKSGRFFKIKKMKHLCSHWEGVEGENCYIELPSYPKKNRSVDSVSYIRFKSQYVLKVAERGERGPAGETGGIYFGLMTVVDYEKKLVSLSYYLTLYSKNKLKNGVDFWASNEKSVRFKGKSNSRKIGSKDCVKHWSELFVELYEDFEEELKEALPKHRKQFSALYRTLKKVY